MAGIVPAVPIALTILATWVDVSQLYQLAEFCHVYCMCLQPPPPTIQPLPAWSLPAAHTPSQQLNLLAGGLHKFNPELRYARVVTASAMGKEWLFSNRGVTSVKTTGSRVWVIQIVHPLLY